MQRCVTGRVYFCVSAWSGSMRHGSFTVSCLPIVTETIQSDHVIQYRNSVSSCVCVCFHCRTDRRTTIPNMYSCTSEMIRLQVAIGTRKHCSVLCRDGCHWVMCLQQDVMCKRESEAVISVYFGCGLWCQLQTTGRCLLAYCG